MQKAFAVPGPLTNIVQSCHRPKGLWGAPLLAAAIVTTSLPPPEVLAANECGVVAGPAATAVCDGIAGNTGAAQGAVNITPNSDAGDSSPFANGISYSALDGFALLIRNGVTISRAEANGASGIELANATNTPLSISLSSGVSIDVAGLGAHGVSLKQVGSGTVRITSGANIRVKNPDTDPLNQSGSAALTGWVQNATSAASISIEQLAGSEIEVAGQWSNGLLGFQEGLGSISLKSSGSIKTTGLNAYAVLGYGYNGSSHGDVVLEQTETGSIFTDGSQATALYALQYGNGDSSITVAGHLETLGDTADAALSYIVGAGSGDVSITVANHAEVVTHGLLSRGAWALSEGTGRLTLLSAGTIRTYGENSAGLLASAYDAANSQPISVTLSSGASITTEGRDAHGIAVEHFGTGEAIIDLGGGTYVATSGSGASGVAAYTSGVVEVIQTAGSKVAASGDNAAGLKVEGSQVAVDAKGEVSATGSYGVGVLAEAQGGSASIAIGPGAVVSGGWQATTNGLGVPLGVAAAGVQIGSDTSSLLANYGLIQAGSDRAVADTGRQTANAGNLTIENHGTITGFVELASGGANTFNNHSFNSFDIRHFADTDGDGVRDTKRVAISDFGGPGAVFNNAATGAVRFAEVVGAAYTDATGFYLPTVGANNRSLEASFYNMSRNGVVQGQLVNLATFNNAGVIDLRGPTVGNTLLITANAAAGGPAGNGLFVSNGGTLLLNTTLNAGIPLGGQTGSHSDMLIVDGTQLGTGATAISVFNRGGLGAVTAGNGIALVEVRNQGLSQPGVFVLNGDFVSNGQQAIVGGLYAYALEQNGVGADANDGNWYLRSLPGPNGPAPLYQPGVALYEAYPAILRRLNTLPTFRQRVGERYYEPINTATGNGQIQPASGVWGRLEAGWDYSDPGLTVSDTSFQTTGLHMQLAADGLLHENAQGKLIAALTAQYGTSQSTVSSIYGTGTVGTTTYGVGGTLSWLNDSGFYIDGQLRVNWYGSDLFSNELRRVLARQNGGLGVTTGAEVGQDLWLDDHWKLTPQAQLIYSDTSFDSFSDPYGARVVALGGDSLRGRLGLAANYLNTWQDNAGETSSLDTTAIVNLYNEFLPSGEVEVAGTHLAGRSDSLWGGIVLGATYAWADGKYSLYGDVSAGTTLANFGSSATLHGALGLKVRW